MAGDPPDDVYEVTRNIVTSSGTVRIIIVDPYRHLIEAIKDLADVLKIKVVKDKYQPFKWFIPVNLFKEKLTNRLIRPVLKIPSTVDRMVNKRKSFIKSFQE